MSKKVVLAALLSIATVFGASAQNLKGDISPLKSQKKVKVELDFSGTLVNGKDEDKYIADETRRKTEAEKTQWLTEWNKTLRSNAYSSLIEKLNAAVDFDAGNHTSAKYIIKVKVKNITTGGAFPSPIPRPSAISAVVTFVEKGKTTPFATVEFKKSGSRLSSSMPHFVTRITMSFGELGNDIGNVVKSKLK